MKKLTLLLALTATTVLAGNMTAVSAPQAINAHPQLPAYQELYWDDGVMDGGWCWYTGGNYWAVQFEAPTHDAGHIGFIGAAVYPDWPDSTYQGAYLYVFDDLGGVPGSSVGSIYAPFAHGGSYTWFATDIDISSGTFYIAYRQYGNFPSVDALGYDAEYSGGHHNWTGYEGSWGSFTPPGDPLLRCYWEEYDSALQDSTWGRVKVLY